MYKRDPYAPKRPIHTKETNMFERDQNRKKAQRQMKKKRPYTYTKALQNKSSRL